MFGLMRQASNQSAVVHDRIAAQRSDPAWLASAPLRSLRTPQFLF
jgi:hypothetical protein